MSTFDKWMTTIKWYLLLDFYILLFNVSIGNVWFKWCFFSVFIRFHKNGTCVEKHLLAAEINRYSIIITILFLPFVFNYRKPVFAHYFENDDEE